MEDTERKMYERSLRDDRNIFYLGLGYICIKRCICESHRALHKICAFYWMEIRSQFLSVKHQGTVFDTREINQVNIF